MRIGILTLPLHTNYGGILQAYALQTVLERMGHEVYVIDKEQGRLRLSFVKKLYIYPKRLILKVLGRYPYSLDTENHINRRMLHSMLNTRLFINRYIKRDVVDRLEELKTSDFDALIVGSDQIWNADCLRPNWGVSNGFLKFAENWKVKRIAYAASFGKDTVDYTQKEFIEVRRLITLFDHVSLRESDGVEICASMLNKPEAAHVVDPTMLLKADDYCQLLKEGYGKVRNEGIMVYILDDSEEKKQVVETISKIKRMSAFRVNSKCEDRTAAMNEIVQPPVENWISSFVCCDFVVTDSFHACVFSILFNKQFVVIGNEMRGLSRFSSLLSMFGLENRMVFRSEDMNDLDDIDYATVNQRLKEKRDYSMTFIKHALDNENN